MADVEHSREVKALAVTRLEAMKGDLRHVSARHWHLKVRGSNGSLFKREGTDLVQVVDLVHADWAPQQAEQRRALVARAAKFNVANVAEQEPVFTGISSVPPGRAVLFAHFYDTLDALREQHPRLIYKKMPPMEWQLEVTAGNVIRGPDLKKLCNRLDAFMHQHFLEERQKILAAAKEAGLVDVDEPHGEKLTGPGEGERPAVVMPSLAQGTSEKRTVPLSVALVAFVAALLLGILIGSMVG